MNNFSKVLIACVLGLLSLQSFAKESAEQSVVEAAIDFLAKKEVPTHVRSVIEKHLLSQIKIKQVDLGEEAEKIFRVPVYEVKPFFKLRHIAIIDGKVLKLRKPSSSFILPGYLTLIRDDFLLDSKEKADVLEKAFETIFPYGLKEQVRPVKIDRGWIIFRDDFFKNYVGLIFSTDKKGKITKVEYVLKIDPNTYAYDPPTYSQ